MEIKQLFQKIKATFTVFRATKNCPTDNALQPPKNIPDHDRAYKIRPLLSHFNDSFQAAMEIEQKMAVDEHMIKFTGKNAKNQYVKGKPIPWGFKM